MYSHSHSISEFKLPEYALETYSLNDPTELVI